MNDSTRRYSTDGTPQGTGQPANSRCVPNRGEPGVFTLRLDAGFISGSFVSIDYGEAWWAAACEGAIADAAEANEERADPSYVQGQ